MKRRAQNVHIYFFRQVHEGEYEYAVMQRMDDKNIYQGASGGVRNNESPQQAALRVATYEANVPAENPLFELTSKGYAPANIFGTHVEEWGSDVVVVPIYFFAMPVNEISLSEQHTGVDWHPYAKAAQLFTFDSQKIGLWELNERLLRGNLKRVL